MSESKTIAQISVDTEIIFKRITDLEIGETATYQELSALIGRPIQGEAYGNLCTARRKAFNERQMVFGTIRNEGIRRLDDAGRLVAGRDQISRSRKAARKARRIVATVDPEKLSEDDRRTYESAVMTSTVLELVTKPSKQKRLESAIREAKARIPVADVLKLFAGAE